jgi:D-alanyl-D-alanine dipeptidase
LRSLLPAVLVFVASVKSALAEPELVDIRAVDPTIAVELRYAGSRNITGKPIYPSNMPALARPEVARRLAQAQAILRPKGVGLKIWDAYRPKYAHDRLWELSPITDYVADPKDGGSLHTSGAAVDATLVDSRGRDVKMPTDFDDFSLSAMLRYTGPNNDIRRNLRMLQSAMGRAGFYGMRTEWWHFVSKDWQSYRPINDFPLAGVPAAPLTAVQPIPPAAPARAAQPQVIAQQQVVASRRLPYQAAPPAAVGVVQPRTSPSPTPRAVAAQPPATSAPPRLGGGGGSSHGMSTRR